MADKICLHRAERSFSRFSTTSHFAEPDQTLISLNFNDSTNEPSPVAAVCMSERRLQWNRHGRGPDVSNFHGLAGTYARAQIHFPFLIFISHLSFDPKFIRSQNHLR